MWKQTNLGYLRVDRLGCRLRRLASEGEPSLFDSVLDSTPRENTSATNCRSIIRNHKSLVESNAAGTIEATVTLIESEFERRQKTTFVEDTVQHGEQSNNFNGNF